MSSAACSLNRPLSVAPIAAPMGPAAAAPTPAAARRIAKLRQFADDGADIIYILLRWRIVGGLNSGVFAGVRTRHAEACATLNLRVEHVFQANGDFLMSQELPAVELLKTARH